MPSLKDQLKLKIEQNQRSHQRARVTEDQADQLIVERVAVSRIRPNPFQPRQVFAHEQLEELARSIEREGLIQPIVVRPDGVRGYQLISGERRLRAFQHLGRDEIPALISPMNDQESAVAALQENLKREDLSDFEIGVSLGRLRDLLADRGVQSTMTSLATLISVSRPAVYRYLAFLALPELTRARLAQTPQLLSGSSALLIERWRGERGATLSEERYVELLEHLLDELAGGLPQRSVSALLERWMSDQTTVDDDESTDDNTGDEERELSPLRRRVKPQKLMRSGEHVGRRSEDEHEIKITLKRGALSDRELERLDEFLSALTQGELE